MPAPNAQKPIAYMPALQARGHFRAQTPAASQSAYMRSTSESSSPLDTFEAIPWSVLGCCCWFSLEPGLPTQLLLVFTRARSANTARRLLLEPGLPTQLEGHTGRHTDHCDHHLAGFDRQSRGPHHSCSLSGGDVQQRWPRGHKQTSHSSAGG